MVYTRPTFGTVFRVNWRFLWAYFWGWLATACWSSDTNLAQHFEGPMHWAFYGLSVLCALICWSLLTSNISRIATNLKRDREVAKFNTYGHAPRSDRMANRNDLKKGGLIR
jgi:hypothetical protein